MHAALPWHPNKIPENSFGLQDLGWERGRLSVSHNIGIVLALLEVGLNPGSSLCPASADSLRWLFPSLPVLIVSLRSNTDTPSSRDSPDPEQHLAGNCGSLTSPNSQFLCRGIAGVCAQSSPEPGSGGSRWQQSPARARCARERSVCEGCPFYRH